MARRLILFRHAKSAWDEAGLEDFDRGLAARGIEAAPRMAEWIAATGYIPDLVLCSSAQRTRATFDLARRPLGLGSEHVCYLDELYHATPATLLATVRAASDPVSTLMIIGHNPGLQDFAIMMIGSGDAELIRALSIKLPTAAVVVLTFDGGWDGLAPRSCALEAYMTPRTLRA
ncbi:MAG: histidine phosphatase family protein [Hyphomicrobiaceae bacterium]